MCGIVGFIHKNRNNFSDNLIRKANSARDSLKHRGPDSKGSLFYEDKGVFLAHRRLSILDISNSGAQPMISSCGRYTISFNGEIYNFREIKKYLDSQGFSIAWKGNSDTEVFLESISFLGLKETLVKCRGMFAFAIWDHETNILTIARDRIGQKPLYYGLLEGEIGFAFSSELKALKILSSDYLRISESALSLFLRFSYIPEPFSIYENIYKLPPGCLLNVDLHSNFSQPKEWWSFKDLALKNNRNPLKESIPEQNIKFEKILFKAIEEQMVSDVPIGAFLSGGIDSSLVVAMMQSISRKPIKTFTIGFNENDYDESSYAKKIANFLGTDHKEFIVSPKETLEIIPKLPYIYDEPFADSSQIPTSILCMATSKEVKVSLSGDGGDELFGGYSRYIIAESIWKKISKLPLEFRQIISFIFSSVPISFWNTIYTLLVNFIPRKYKVTNPGNKILKISNLLKSISPEHLYYLIVSQWLGDLPLKKISEPNSLISNPMDWINIKNMTEKFMALDTITYLPDDILVKLDRAAMYSSLETRVPFLDERIISLATKLPYNQKIKNNNGKIILKNLLYKFLPEDLFNRPKQGFGVPLEKWLRCDIKEWANELLSVKSLDSSGLIDPISVRSIWERHLSGENHQASLWNILMFQAWLEKEK